MTLLADITLSIYFGASQTRASDLIVSQPARGNRATLHSVAWHDYPGRAPVYYGLRLTYNAPGHPWTRIALDYTHLKIYADTSQRVAQDGTWHGVRFSDVAPMRERVQGFEITHGVNLLGIALLQQISGPGAGGVYAGGGPVIYLPHTESTVDGKFASTGYSYGGGGFQLLAGVRGCAGVQPLFGEIKYSHGAPDVEIAQGRARTRVDAVHELAGVETHRCAK